jgi:nitrous oxide reductase
MQRLESAQIEKLATRKDVRSVAVYNFLGTAPLNSYNDYLNALGNLDMDARLYKWNAQTVKAIRDGLKMAMNAI